MVDKYEFMMEQYGFNVENYGEIWIIEIVMIHDKPLGMSYMYIYGKLHSYR